MSNIRVIAVLGACSFELGIFDVSLTSGFSMPTHGERKMLPIAVLSYAQGALTCLVQCSYIEKNAP